MHRNVRSVLVCGAAVCCLLSRCGPCAGAEPNDGVKLLYGFELAEILGDRPTDLSARDWLFVGKEWPGGEPEPGWRVRDHLGELKLPEGHQGPVTVYRPDGSRDRPMLTLYPKGATQGRYARRYVPRTWRYIRGYAEGKALGLTAQPTERSYHDVQDWFWQREGNIFDDALEHRYDRRDWSGYEYLRVDVLAEGAPAILGMRAMDAGGPRIGAHHLGLRTVLSVFHVPQDEQVTLNFRLGELARAAEMDLSKMMGFVIRINGYAGEATLLFDNIRLVRAAAADAHVERAAGPSHTKHPLVEMQGPVRPFARPVIHNPAPRDPQRHKRKTGPVEALGPVTVYEGTSSYSSARMLLGGGGWTYFQSLKRGCVAYDNDRLLVLFGRFLAAASFDGGATWGGLQPGDPGPVALGWGNEYRGTASSDRSDLYFLGTENCTSYHEGSDVLFRRLAMTGPGWTDDRVALVDQNLRKCPPDMRAFRLDSGRIWAAWTDGWKGDLAKHSDDDGYTWAPCKDASEQAPRPFYCPEPALLAQPADRRPKPPETILPWPGEVVCGSVLLPYGDTVAVLGHGGTWQIRKAEGWNEPQQMPWGVPYGATATALDKRLFLSRGARYSDTAAEPPIGALEVAVLDDGRWSTAVLEESGVGDTILTACADAVFLFYVRHAAGQPGDSVFARRWADGRWGPPLKVADESFRINHLAAPVIGAPAYAAVWWDQWKVPRGEKMKLRFARMPNNNR